MDAIRAFYEKDGFKFKPERDFPYIAPASDVESWIELEFSLSDADDASLADDYRTPDKPLRVRKYFKASDKSKDGVIFGYRSDGTLSADSFYGAKNVQSGKIGDIVFIPAVSKVDEFAKLSGPSALRDLLTNVLEAVVASSPSYQQFSHGFDAFAKGIKDETTEDGRSLSGLESELSGLLESWGTTFHLDMQSPSTAEIIKSLLTWECVDKVHGKALAVEQYGSGFHRHLIYTLIQVTAKYGVKKTSKKTKDFTPSMRLILFEEPEAFLHPPQQEVLAHNLATLAQAPDQQVLCSTHSSHFVSRRAADIPSIACLRRDGGRVSISQIDRSAWDEIVDANQALNNISTRWPKLKARLESDDLLPEMEAVKYFLWLNPGRCSMFFANQVLIVEGPTEQAFITRLIDEGAMKRPCDGLYVLDSIGKYNIHRFMNLLAHLAIRHSVLHDDDDNRDEHAEINHLIQESRHENFTLAVKTIPGDLETFLGVPKCGSDHRKPQHLLLCHEKGQIAQCKLEEFCTLVESCLATAVTGATA
jgi:hypothetical protein